MSGLDIEGVLLAHVPLGDDAEGIEQCSCGVLAVWRRDDLDDDVRYLPSHAEGPDLRWHAAHVAAVLREQIAAAQAEAWDERSEARPQYLGPNNGHYDDCMGWEDCWCASYPNPYRAALVAPSRVPGEET